MCSQGGGVYVSGGMATFTDSNIFSNTASGSVRLPSPHPMAPMEVVSMNCLSCLQGGGVYVGSVAVVSFTDCDIHDNYAEAVRTRPGSIPWTQWK